MPFAVTCAGCRYTFQARDDLAGKRVKCPGCGALVAIPAVAAALGPRGPQAHAPAPSRPAEEAEEAAAPAAERPRKRRRKRRNSDEPAAPLFSLLGIEFTPVKLLFALPCVLAFAAGLFFLFRLFFTPSEPDVRVVDLYMAVNSVRYTDVGERALNSATVAYTIPGHRKLVVTRDNPEGGFLLMKVRVPNEVLDRYLPKTPGSYMLSQGYIKLQGGTETVEALYVTDRDAVGMSLQMGFSPPQQERGPVTNLRDCLGPGAGQYSGWTHDGKLTELGSTLRYDGRSGMKVTTQTSAERMGGQEGNVLSGLTGANIGKGIEAGGLVAGPAAYVRVSWDEDSRGWMVATEVERPNDLSRSWEITCLFPRPKGSGKELTLLVFNKEQAIKLP